MITYSIIQKSQLEGAKRLDAEYYQPEYLIFFKKINNFKTKRVGEITKVLRGNTPKEYGEYEIPVVRSGDLSNFFIKENLLRTKNHKIFYLSKNDVLISSIGFGSIGKVNIFNKENNKFGTVSEVSVIRNSKLSAIYLWAFLRSKFGQFQINREITGATGQLHLNTKNVENIIIPIISGKEIIEIEKIFTESENLYQNSKSLYRQAENLLLEELKLSEKDLNNQLSCVVNLSEAKAANRFDAEYFEPKYQKITEHVKKNFKWSLLGDLASVKKGFEPGAESYREEGKQFIRVSSLSKYEISDSEQKCLSEELYNKLKADYQPQPGEILLTKDASPGIAYVLKENIEGIISSGILRLKLKNKEIEDEYMALCLNSIIGKMQAERDAGGSVIMHWKPEEIKNVVIPILPKPIQEKISYLVRQSFEFRKRAKQLLEKSKKKVEEMIEKA